MFDTVEDGKIVLGEVRDEKGRKGTPDEVYGKGGFWPNPYLTSIGIFRGLLCDQFIHLRADVSIRPENLLVDVHGRASDIKRARIAGMIRCPRNNVLI